MAVSSMDRDANYVAVGAFVLLVLAMAVTFVFWYTDQQEKRSYQRYEIYFNGTVSGLNEGAPVRYLGVNVGQIARITLDPDQRKRVQVIADIDSTAPIDSRTLASLSLQGITGLLFIDLEQDKNAATPRPLAQGLRYPVIRSAPSDFDVLLSSLPELTTHTVELVDRFNRVFSDQNLKAFQATLDNARAASERLPQTLRALNALLADVQSTSRQIEGAAADLRVMAAHAAPDILLSVADVHRVAGNLEATSEKLDHFVADNQPALSQFTKHSLPQFEQLIRESRDAARDFRDLSRSLREDPTQLIYEPATRGLVVPR
jgi:phospholipid/cholesterol/gamma-HCH transport system substrate-binding protein